MNEIDAEQSAWLLVKQYGEKAAAVAAAQAARFQEAGDGEGMTIWVGIMMAIWDLTHNGPDGEKSAKQ